MLRRFRHQVVRELLGWVESDIARSLDAPRSDVFGGALSVVHRCGSSLDINVHLHVMMLDGAYLLERGAEPVFHPAAHTPPPRVLARLARRLRAHLRSVSPPPNPPASAARRVRIEQQPARGPSAVRVRRVEVDRSLAAQEHGLRLRVGARIEASQRDEVLRLASYMVRAEFDPSAVSHGPNGSVRYRLLRPFADGTTHVELSRREFAERLRAIVPHARSSVTFHGALAPRAWIRERLAPRQLELLSPATAPSPRQRSGEPATPRTGAVQCPACESPMVLVAVETIEGSGFGKLQGAPAQVR